MARTRTAVVIFARSPEREHKHLGLSGAGSRHLHESLFATTLDTVERALPDAPVFILADGLADLRRRFPRAGFRHHWFAQEGDSFERRLLGGLTAVANRGFGRLVVLGTDTPTLSIEDLRQSANADGATAVIGPSRDGGFYLLSIASPCLSALRGLPWHGTDVTERLHDRLSASGVKVRRLAVRDDVDDVRTVRRLFHVLNGLSRRHVGTGLTLTRATFRRPSRQNRPHIAPTGTAFTPRAPPIFRAFLP